MNSLEDRDPLGIVGRVVADKYKVEKLVGEGGFAVVYRAQHAIWQKPVAIKFFNGLSSAPIDQRDLFQQAFIQEGALLTELSSQTAGIVQARDIGTYTTPDGSWMPFMVLEWLEGSSLEALLERERAEQAPPWTLTQMVRLLGQAAAALDVAHGRGIAHRDVKPANFFVLGEDARGGRATLKVLDFGVAKMVTDNTQLQAALARTGTNVTSFTPAYGAPEQFSRSHGATGPWTDVFSLALVAVEMLSGKPALDGEDVVQLAICASHPDRRPTPRALGVPVSDEVEAVFQKALAPRPEHRYARSGEFWAELEAVVFSGAMSRTGGAPVSRVAAAATELGTSPEPSRSADTEVSAQHVTTGTPSTLHQNAPRERPNPWLFGSMAIAVLAAGSFMLFSRRPADEPLPAPAAVRTSAEANAAPLPPAPPPAVAATCPERMAKIPAGQFFRGSDAKDAQPDEKPAHQVTLSTFCIDLYEVTSAEYRSCSDQGKCKRAGSEVEWPKITAQDRKIYSPLCTGNDPEKGQHPINCVTWEMSDLYCKALGKRLPSEAEWEYATRGPDGRVYPWGDEMPTEKHLNACGPECVLWGKRHNLDFEALYPKTDGFATTAPIGSFEAGRSRFGPYDVVGNVWEWVNDWYGEYSAEQQNEPTGPSKGERRVMRGGGWNGSYATWLRPSFRYAQDPAAMSHGIGFRCAKTL